MDSIYWIHRTERIRGLIVSIYWIHSAEGMRMWAHRLEVIRGWIAHVSTGELRVSPLPVGILGNEGTPHNRGAGS